jgi:hypothetical protein
MVGHGASNAEADETFPHEKLRVFWFRSASRALTAFGSLPTL